MNNKKLLFEIAFITVSSLFIVGISNSCSSTPEKDNLAKESAMEWNELVDKTIRNKDAANKVKDLGVEMIILTEKMQEDIEKLSEKAVTLNKEYDTPDNARDLLLSQFTEIRKKNFEKYNDLIFDIRAEVTAEEWEKLIEN